MRMGIAQFRPRLGRVEQNVEIHIEMIRKAKAAGVDVLIFPELSLTGYTLLDATYDAARKTSSEEIRTLIAEADGIDLAFGFVEHASDHQLYNAAMYASQQRLLHMHRKVYLPTYGMFDEARYFSSGKRIRRFSTRFGRMGLLICEDALHVSASYLLAMDGAELILILSNSPANGMTADGIRSQKTWQSMLSSQAISYGTYMIFANRVGNEDGLSFYGGSTILDPFGRQMNDPTFFEETLLTIDLDMDAVRQARFQRPLLRSENIDLTLRELNRIHQAQIGGEEG